MKAVNKFTGGVKKFKDYSFYKNTEWTFPTINIRIVNTGDQGFLIIPMNSNEEAFSVNSDYIVIGAKEYKGIIYLISVNKTNNGFTEIGCYPSPKTWSETNTEFEKTYKPLHNYYNGSSVVDLKTDKFGYTTNHEIELIIKEIKDSSVNLYISDYNNPNIVINNGFNIYNGSTNGQLINNSHFGNSMNHIVSSEKNIDPIFKGLNNGGNLKPGNYELYFRYVDSNFNRTNFLGQMYPIVVGNLGDIYISAGVPEEDVYKHSNNTSSNITINIPYSTLDLSFKYIEIAVIRKSYTETSGIIYDSYLINKLYKIETFSNGNDTVITGFEDKISLPKEEILFSLPTSNTNKTHTIVKSRYYGGNWKGFQYDKMALSEYAKNITASYHVGTTINDACKYSDLCSNNYQHKRLSISEGQITYDFTQYFRGEIVPFGVVFILKGGFETEVFPINGGDYWDSATGFDELSKYGEVKGLYRFPAVNPTNATLGLIDSRKPMGIKFNNFSAISLLSNTDYDFSNVIGFYYVRGKKIENLIYQGLSVPMSKMVVDLSGSTSSPTIEDYSLDGEIPCISPGIIKLGSRYFTGLKYDVSGVETIDIYKVFPITEYELNVSGEVDKANRYQRGIECVPDEMAIYAPDHIFDLINNLPDNTNVVIETIFKYENIYYTYDNIKHKHILDYNTANSGTTKSIDFHKYNGVIKNVEAGSGTKGNLFAYTEGYEVDNSKSIYFREQSGSPDLVYSNRSMSKHKYLHIKLNANPGRDIWNCITNIYLYDNTFDNTGATGFFKSSYEGFNPATAMYWRISNVSLLNNNTSSDINYKGDSMYHRVYLRENHPFGGDSYIDKSEEVYKYNHGVLYSIDTENRINVAMRNEVVAFDPDDPNSTFEYSYYPLVRNKSYSFDEWLTDPFNKNVLYEAIQVNRGYNELDCLNKKYGFDIDRSYNNLTYNTRIYFSLTSTKNELDDSFRKISMINYQDFPVEYGDIIKLIELNGELVSIQEHSINRHYLGQQKMSSNNSSDIVLKNTGLFLSKQFKKLSNFGTQHQKSIIKTDDFCYGVDAKSQLTIWMISQGQTTSGAITFGVKDISTEKEIRGWLDDLIEQYNLNDITNNIDDNPVNAVGIVSGWNKKYKEIYFSFHLRAFTVEYMILKGGTLLDYKIYSSSKSYVNYETVYVQSINQWSYMFDDESGTPTSYFKIKGLIKFYQGIDVKEGYAYYDNATCYMAHTSTNNVQSINDLKYEVSSVIRNQVFVNYEAPVQRTIMYSELLQTFIGEVSFVPGKYMKLQSSMLTQEDSENSTSNKIYIHDVEGDYLNFFGQDKEMKISVIVNGGEKALMIMKVFGSYQIATNKEELYKIEFSTDTMNSEINPFIPTQWKYEGIKPKYKENSWRGPIPYNHNTDKFGVDKDLHGEWIKIIITFKQNKYFYIREIITNYIQSFI